VRPDIRQTINPRGEIRYVPVILDDEGRVVEIYGGRGYSWKAIEPATYWVDDQDYAFTIRRHQSVKSSKKAMRLTEKHHEHNIDYDWTPIE
jgi:hypothetical protein